MQRAPTFICVAFRTERQKRSLLSGIYVCIKKKIKTAYIDEVMVDIISGTICDLLEYIQCAAIEKLVNCRQPGFLKNLYLR